MRKGAGKKPGVAPLRRRAEDHLKEKKPEAGFAPDETDLKRLVHELQVHQIELEMQNEELKRAREEVEEVLARYIDLYDFAPVGYLTFDEKGLISELNLTAAQLLGIERSFLVGKPFSSFIQRELQDRFYLHLQNVLESSAKQTCELVLKKKDGATFDAQLESIIVRAKGHRLVHSVLTDISVRKQAEDRIANLTRLYAVLSRVNEIIVRTRDEKSLLSAICRIVAEEGKFLLVWIGMTKEQDVVPVASCGPAVGYLRGIKVEVNGTLGKGPTGTCIKEDRPVVNVDFETNQSMSPWREAAARYGFRASAAFPLHCHGKVVGAFTIYAPEPNTFDAEQVRLLESLSADISYALDALDLEQLRMQYEKYLLRAKEEWERTFAGVPDMIAILDNNHRVLRVNEAMARSLKVTTEECIGLPCYEVVHGLSSPPEFCPHTRTMKDFCEHTVQIYEKRLERDFEVTTTPIYDDQGNMTGSVHVAHDITGRRRAEEELKASRDELEERVQQRTAELSDAYDELRVEMEKHKKTEEQLRQAHKMEAIGTLAGGIAHDFNNLLAAIMGFTEMVIEDLPEGSQEVKNLCHVLKSAHRGRDLVKQILTFSRKSDYVRGSMSLTPLITETIQLLRASIPSTIKIVFKTSATLDTVLASPTEIQQMLMNLATNAALAMQDKGGTLEINLNDIDFQPDTSAFELDIEPGEYIQLVFKDAGNGMAPEVMKRIFEPFFTTREVGKGTGMGLAVVYGIVTDLHGTITVESEPGVGSLFRVFLPKIKSDVKSESTKADDSPGGSERVLFLDDEELLVEWGHAALTRLGYKVTSMTDSMGALKTFSADPSQFDLFITDQTMPGLTGIQLAREFLAIRRDIPIILFTGHSETVTAEEAQAAGIKEFLMKPFGKQELAGAMRRVLDMKC
jgi:PAS domain S-box-containing protein